MRHHGRHSDNHYNYNDGPDKELHVRPIRRTFVPVVPREKNRALLYTEVNFAGLAEPPICPLGIGAALTKLKPKAEAFPNAAACRRKFLRFFPKGFHDETYLAWERDYKWQAHEKWEEALNPETFRSLLRKKVFAEIASRSYDGGHSDG